MMLIWIKFIRLSVLTLTIFSYCVLAEAVGLANVSHKSEIHFKHSLNRGASVKFVFDGFKFDMPVDIDGDFSRQDKKLDAENAKPYVDFLSQYFLALEKRQKSKVLDHWVKDEAVTMEEEMTTELLKKSSRQYQAMTSRELKMVIKYADFHIAFVRHSYGDDQKWVGIYPLKRVSGSKFLMSNALVGDYFYDEVLLSLDEENFQFTTRVSASE